MLSTESVTEVITGTMTGTLIIIVPNLIEPKLMDDPTQIDQIR
jgi:hypothetical protein